MSTENPEVGEVSADGQFRWDGQDWAPLARGHREPTPWTQPLQRATAAFLTVSLLWALLGTALFVNPASIGRSLRASNPNLTPDQVQAAQSVGYATGWVTVLVLAVVYVVLIVGSLRRWRWAFWVNIVALAFGAIGVLTNSFALASPATQTQPPAAIAVGLLLSVVSAALLVWLIVAAARFGPWAMRRPGAG